MVTQRIANPAPGYDFMSRRDVARRHGWEGVRRDVSEPRRQFKLWDVVARLSECDEISQSAGDLYYVVGASIGGKVVTKATHGDGMMGGPAIDWDMNDLVRVHHHDGEHSCIAADHGEGDGWIS